jgi:hypothetical protein
MMFTFRGWKLDIGSRLFVLEEDGIKELSPSGIYSKSFDWGKKSAGAVETAVAMIGFCYRNHVNCGKIASSYAFRFVNDQVAYLDDEFILSGEHVVMMVETTKSLILEQHGRIDRGLIARLRNFGKEVGEEQKS